MPLLAEHGPREFAAHFLSGAGIDWAAGLLAGLKPRPRIYPPKEKCRMKKLALGAAAAAAAPVTYGRRCPLPAVPVFDSANYSQNLLTAARTLQQINQQIQSLQNEAQLLANQREASRRRSIFRRWRRCSSGSRQIDRLMGQAQGIDFRVDRLDEQFRQAFPTSFEHLGPAR